MWNLVQCSNVCSFIGFDGRPHESPCKNGYTLIVKVCSQLSRVDKKIF